MDNFFITETSKPPTGRRSRARASLQENNFFEKITNSVSSFNDSNANEAHSTRHSPLEHSQSPAPLTHRSANFLNSPPPVKPRTKKYEQTKLEDESLLDASSVINPSDICLRGVFTLDTKTIDLELTKTKLKWRYVNEMKPRSASKSTDYEFNLDHFYSIEPKMIPIRPKSHSRTRRESIEVKLENAKRESQVSVTGFVLHAFRREKTNVYKHKSITFEHPHRETCNEWINKLSELLPVVQVTRHVLVLLNPYSGERKTRAIFNGYLFPLFNTAKITYKIIEFHENLNLKESLTKNEIQFSDYYGIVIMAGDSGVSNAINTIIELTNYEDGGFKINETNDLTNKLKPICIIPCGATNLIASSIYGSTDIQTPLMYLFYGTTIKIDLSSIYSNGNKLHSFGFNYSCGFGTTLARYFLRYSRFGVNKVQTSLARGAAKQSHRIIDVEINYLPADESKTTPFDEEICVRDCKLCDLKQHNVHIKLTHDEVENFAPHTINKTKNNSDWKTLKGSYIYISFLTNAALGLNTPGGLSKYAHLGDGYIDLILVEPVPRKDFVRFLRRHSNAKNQLNFPFVKAIRIKEAHIRILNSFSTDSNGLSGKNGRSSQSLGESDDSENEYDDNEEEDHNPDDEIETSQVKTTNNVHRSINTSIENKDAAKVFFIKPTDSETKKKEKGNGNHSRTIVKKSKSIIDLFKDEALKSFGMKNERKKSVALSENGEIFQILNTKKNKSLNKKLLKSPNIWNCDWNLYALEELNIKCNRQFLPVFGRGLDLETDFENSSFTSCITLA